MNSENGGNNSLSSNLLLLLCFLSIFALTIYVIYVSTDPSAANQVNAGLLGFVGVLGVLIFIFYRTRLSTYIYEGIRNRGNVPSYVPNGAVIQGMLLIFMLFFTSLLIITCYYMFLSADNPTDETVVVDNGTKAYLVVMTVLSFAFTVYVIYRTWVPPNYEIVRNVIKTITTKDVKLGDVSKPTVPGPYNKIMKSLENVTADVNRAFSF